MNGKPSTIPGLPEVFASIKVPRRGGFLRKLLAFAGPAYLVSVGYMDPGNWATDIEGGARFGYRLLWVLLFSNVMAIFLQTLAARLGLATRKDLAQASRDYYPSWAAIPLWFLCEVAIIACDLAEVLGGAIGIHLLTGLPLLPSVLLMAGDVFILLVMQQLGWRWIEAVVVLFVAATMTCFAVELFIAHPDWSAAAAGLTHVSLDHESLYVAIAIIGATVMPHNLYLHSALVQTRAVARNRRDIAQAARFNVADSLVALNLAFLVNAAILIMAAATFHSHGLVISELSQAHDLLNPLLGSTIAAPVFAIALICSGQSSTLTVTLAGQIVMSGFLDLQVAPWLRRLVTRLLAVGPAAAIVAWQGESGGYRLLIFSQVILSLQLPFAVFPLVQFTSDPAKMGRLVNPGWVKALAWLMAWAIVALNVWLVVQAVSPA